MQGRDLFEEFSKRIMQEKGTQSVADKVLAAAVGITPRLLGQLRKKELTPHEVADLFDAYARANETILIQSTVVPIVEFLQLDLTESSGGANWQLFWIKDELGTDHPYYAGLKQRLDSRHGIYVFHDSRGRAIYAGKAQRQTLWAEMNKALNRDRGEVQNIKRVTHPHNRVQYKGLEERRRQIVKQPVALYHIASYCSAYEVPDQLIGKFEALIVRAFANDLLNVRMENF